MAEVRTLATPGDPSPLQIVLVTSAAVLTVVLFLLAVFVSARRRRLAGGKRACRSGCGGDEHRGGWGLGSGEEEKGGGREEDVGDWHPRCRTEAEDGRSLLGYGENSIVGRGGLDAGGGGGGGEGDRRGEKGGDSGMNLLLRKASGMSERTDTVLRRGLGRLGRRVSAVVSRSVRLALRLSLPPRDGLVSSKGVSTAKARIVAGVGGG
ncbi:hypothetical protein VTG60DRAFT_3883 [Thermothelomyces hinnuleus]